MSVNKTNKFLHVDYENLEIEYEKLTMLEIIDYVCLIDSYIYNNFGNQNKNNKLLKNLFDQLSKIIAKNINEHNKSMVTNTINNFTHIYQTNFSICFKNILEEINCVLDVQTFDQTKNLYLIVFAEIKNYINETSNKLISINDNNQDEIFILIEEKKKLELLVGLANDYEIIKDNLEKNFNQKKLAQNFKSKINSKIQNEILQYINQIIIDIDNNIDILLSKISHQIILDCENIDDEQYLNLVNSNDKLKLDTLIATTNDYLSDLNKWLININLSKFYSIHKSNLLNLKFNNIKCDENDKNFNVSNIINKFFDDKKMILI